MDEWNIRNAVRVFVINDDKVLCIRYKGKYQGIYDLPGGKIEEGESPEETCIREVKEETGIDVSDLKYIGVHKTIYPESKRIFLLNTYITKTFSGKIEETKENDSMWMSIDDLRSQKSKFSTVTLLDQEFIHYLIDGNMNIEFTCDEQAKIIDIKEKKKINILIGSKNPGKIEGAKQALSYYFDDYDIEGIPVSSDVSEEPVNTQIYQGARNRVENLINYAQANGIQADYFLGIESGITNLLGQWMIVNVAVIKDKDGYESFGTSPGFPVPTKYVDQIISTDLGKVMDSIFETNDLRSNIGGISFVTNGVINRIDLTKEAFVMALTKHINNVWTDKPLTLIKKG